MVFCERESGNGSVEGIEVIKRVGDEESVLVNPLAENTCISKFKIYFFSPFLSSITIIATIIIQYYADAMEGRGRPGEFVGWKEWQFCGFFWESEGESGGRLFSKWGPRFSTLSEHVAPTRDLTAHDLNVQIVLGN